MRKFSPHLTAVFVSLLLFSLSQVAAQTLSRPAAPAAISTAFTYQGRLMSGSSPASGVYPMTFRLFDAPSGGSQVGIALTVPVSVTGGLFTAQLDFGAGVFANGPRWLAITVNGTDLAPRQPLTAAPYALYAPQAGHATTAQTASLALAAQTAPWSGINGVPADLADGDQVGLTSVGWTDVLSRPAGLDDGDQVGLTSVGWSDVLSRPAGLDDGDDNTTYTAGVGLALQGTQFRAQGSAIGNVVIVAKSGGDFTAIQAALNSITTASATNQYLVYVAPGIYTEQVTLKPYVTLEGAGEGVTIIRWTGGPQFPGINGTSATVTGANNATLRHVTIESIGTGNEYAVSLSNRSAAPRVSHVTISAMNSNRAYAVYNENASPTLESVTATASAGNTVNYGVYNNSASPMMKTVTATATGSGTTTIAVYNNTSSPTMDMVTAAATGAASVTSGVYSVGSSPTMRMVTATAAGGSTTYAVYNFRGSPTLHMVTATATSTTGSIIGVYNDGSPAVIRESFLSGGSYSILNEGMAIVRVSTSQLSGPYSAGMLCFGNYAANLTPITCS